MKPFLKLLISITICFLAAGIGSYATTPAIPNWYASLNKPNFAPPNWIFGPVWTLLYLMMGIALYLIIKDGINNTATKKAIVAFATQLTLNSLWSIIFFGLQSPLGGMMVITFLWLAIKTTIVLFRYQNRLAAKLLYPYLIWVTFAALLNLAIWQLN